ncbi:MAG: NAD(P)/FAD-dependent oxidoreductase [Bacteroidales bacterium]|nr:NAD(P)/FAD-dependent oxidoreductase [Bacteroidales bacterium]
MPERKKVIVIGGGFAGIQFIEHLDNDLFDVLLIDKLNHHQFQPLFYQVATSQLEPSSISFPFRKIFQEHKNMQIRMAEVLRVDPVTNTVITTVGNFRYDFLVIATGCRTNYFGNRNIEENVYSLKTTYEAIKIRNSILQDFEDLLTTPESEKEYLLNIVIVGAGPTGVELAGAFAEIKRNILPKDYPMMDFKDLKIILLEGSGHTLNSMSETARRVSEKYLRSLGVSVMTNVFVTDYDGKLATLNNGTTIKTTRLIWTAGVTGNVVEGIDKSLIVRNGRIMVDRYNKVRGYDNVFAVGDISYMETLKYPSGHPQVANVAINQARNLARNLRAMIKGKRLKEYEYRNLGSMATIGKNKAVVDLPFIRFHGYFAWFVWMFLHLMLILSIRNKLIVFINWAINYVTKDTSLRLILQEKGKS